MWRAARDHVLGAVRDFSRAWRALVATDVNYKVLGFAVLTPATLMFLRWIAARAHRTAVADADIARFFLTTRSGVTVLVLGGSILLAIGAVQLACLMAIGYASADGTVLRATSALAFGASRAWRVLRLAFHFLLRIFALALPTAGLIGIVYLALLREHDINYYLARKPNEFWVAAVLAGVIGVGAVAVLVRWIARWSLALPIVIFEDVAPRNAFGESARRTEEHRGLVLAVLAAWLVVAAAVHGLAVWLPDAIGRAVAPHFVGSLALLLAFIAALVLLWVVLGTAATVVNGSLLALLITRVYRHAGPRCTWVPPAAAASAPGGRRLSARAVAGIASVSILLCTGIALLAFASTRVNQPVLVIGHRGASAEAPENTLASFRLAAEEHADYIEFDVQESADGDVLVAHDKDLMKIGGSPLQVWQTSTAALREIDIGRHKGPQFAGEHVATLAEVLAAAKGKTKVVIELKQYGHGQRLEERVAEAVEAAGMQDDCLFMSLDQGQVHALKRIRPNWRVGLLVAKGLGDLTSLKADFLAVEARMATLPFIRRAHRAGQQVFVWTVNDPAWMLATMGRGVDGLITDKPALAREVVAQRASMSDAQRLLVALLVRLGANSSALESEEALRP